jgi:hypothetical protein
MGRQQRRGHTRYWYKHGRFFGRDIAAAELAVLTLTLGHVDRQLLVVPGVCALAQLVAILFNQLRYKRKRPVEALQVLPVQILYYAARTASALKTRARIALRLEPAIRASREAWLRQCGPPTRCDEPRR